MTETPPPLPAREAGTRPSPAGKIILIVVLSLVALVILAGVMFFTFFGGGPVDITDDVTAGTSVSVDLPAAAFTFRPSTDDRVHLTAHGFYLGAKPTITVNTSDGVTTITGGCANRWFSVCSLDVTVTLPASLRLTVEGQNGGISASGLTGPLSLQTTNGAIETSGTQGRIDLHTTNGAIRVRAATSSLVTAGTTNGSVELSFVDAPTTVVATSTNGSVTVRVPVDGVTYFVSARTTNGNTDADSVPSDRTSTRTITTETTNGNVTVVPR